MCDEEEFHPLLLSIETQQLLRPITLRLPQCVIVPTPGWGTVAPLLRCTGGTTGGALSVSVRGSLKWGDPSPSTASAPCKNAAHRPVCRPHGHRLLLSPLKHVVYASSASSFQFLPFISAGHLFSEFTSGLIDDRAVGLCYSLGSRMYFIWNLLGVFRGRH